MRKMVLGVLMLSVLSFNVVSGMGGALVPAQSREGMEALLDVRIGRSDFEDIIRNAITDVLGDRLCSDGGTEIDAAIRVAARSIEREHVHQMHILALQAQTILQRAESERIQAEKAATLRGLLLRINVDDKTLITKRAADMERLDVVERHKEVESLYERFLPYEELFGRTDLGVEATPDDLGAVKNYIDETPEVLPDFPDFITLPRPGCQHEVRGEYHHAKGVHYNSQIRQIRSTLSSLPSALRIRFSSWISSVDSRLDEVERETSKVFGEEIVMVNAYNSGKMKHYNGRYGDHHLATWDTDSRYSRSVGELSSESERRYDLLKEILRESEVQQILRAINELAFPAESFNRLVDQVNKFLAGGL